jgi:hypothetical protein
VSVPALIAATILTVLLIGLTIALVLTKGAEWR